jgi:hypothetical protein
MGGIALLGGMAVVLTSAASGTLPLTSDGDRHLQVQKIAEPVRVSRQRVALVVGNSAYATAPLLNPVNDARAIAQALRESGFQVIYKENADQRVMLGAIRDFGDRLLAGGTGLFYFAGHGMQIKGRNYLVPVAASIEREDEVAYSTIDAQAILDKMESAGNETNIMILDACRNNPFVRSGRSAQAGLAQMDAPVGTLLAYATSPGSVASDGSGANGLYTQHLLSAMRQEGTKIEDVFKLVRSNVRRDSNGKQVPWESTSLEGDFYFRKATSKVTQFNDGSDALDIALWETVKASNVPIEIRAYLNRFPQGRFVDDARNRLVKLQPPTISSVPANVGSGSRIAAQSEGPRNAPIHITYEVGDSWTFVQEDLLSFRQSTYTHTVTSLRGNGDAEMNGGTHIYTTTGELKFWKQVARTTEFDNGYHLLATQLSSGHQDRVQFENTHISPDGAVRKSTGNGAVNVIGREKVTVPAGAFWAWRMDRRTTGFNSNAEEVTTEDTSWFVPELQRSVAREQKVILVKSGKLSVHDRHLLQDFKLVKAVRMAAVEKNVAYAAQLPDGTVMALKAGADQESVDRRTSELLAELAAQAVADKGLDTARANKSIPLSSARGFSVGDRWRYQVVDKYKNEVVRNFSYKVDQLLTNGTMKWNGGTLDITPEGNILKETSAQWESREFSPNDELVPLEFRVGYRQPVAFTLSARRKSDGYHINEIYSGTLEVLRRERVVVPAGEFDALRIERVLKYEGTGANGSDRWFGSSVVTGWYVPELHCFVARDHEIRVGNKPPTRERIELTSYTVQSAMASAQK